ncbi:MAG TPA: DegT/DnrJ/EryC1/StrS family aminotransferase, partial [Bacteroidetes bacterium]|nr:DegT/DnrJ/EryC1/StrS family aminotransferase [Bacteroidota bacterium]
MKIPIALPYLGEEEVENAGKTILSGWVTQGPRVAEFEENFSSYMGSKYAVAVSNCTTALHLSMIVSGICKGDEVICPSMSFIATANSIQYVGAKPVFAEVNTDYNLDIEDVRTKISSKTKAVLLVHQVGMPADIDGFRQLCDEHNLILIEDAACATGSEYKGQRIGSHSDLVCFSFHPRKVITTGDGGMITTSREDLYERLKRLRQHSMSVNDQVRHQSDKIIFEDYLELGYNYRMTDIQAAIGIEQLKKLDWIISERRKIAKTYINAFKNINCIDLPIESPDVCSNYQSFSILIKENSPICRNDLMQKLTDEGISTRRGIMTAHRQTAYSYRNEKLPISEALSDNSLLIP